MKTFVTVGNALQPFSRLINMVCKAQGELPAPMLVQHGHTPCEPGTYERVDFLEMRQFQEMVSGAELVIMHGGAGSIITAVDAGKCPIVVPRRREYGEHVDDHQVELVCALEQAGRLIVAETPSQLRDGVDDAIRRGKSSVQREPAAVVALLRDDLSAVQALTSGAGRNHS